MSGFETGADVDGKEVAGKGVAVDVTTEVAVGGTSVAGAAGC
jgi:hypothetical protein